MQEHDGFRMTRREVLLAGATTVAAGVAPSASAAASKASTVPEARAPVRAKVAFTVNGKEEELRSNSTHARPCSTRCASTCS